MRKYFEHIRLSKYFFQNDYYRFSSWFRNIRNYGTIKRLVFFFSNFLIVLIIRYFFSTSIIQLIYNSWQGAIVFESVSLLLLKKISVLYCWTNFDWGKVKMTQLHHKCKRCQYILTSWSIIYYSFFANGIIHIGLISVILLAVTGIPKSDPLKDDT